MHMLIQLLINALAFYITAYILPGVTISGYTSLFVIAIIWGILSVVIKPLLIILTLPITILTLGLFTLVINAVLLLITSNIVPGFHIEGFGTAVIAVIVLSIVNSFLNALLNK
ncbi:phage holin family protein [Candidatus Gottesmanbacteria bacterium]|nr:phage holin family protein [Candidatus Gottesmanbacteria bacterium]